MVRLDLDRPRSKGTHAAFTSHGVDLLVMLLCAAALSATC
jgi:hypothetical protein